MSGMPTVLVVDDDPDIRETVGLVLGAHGYRVASAGDGAEALDWLRGNAAPAVILLDLMMPGTDGFEFRARQRADPTLSRVPVVVLTGAGRAAERKQADLEAEVLRKPVELEALLAIVERFAGPAPAA